MKNDQVFALLVMGISAALIVVAFWAGKISVFREKVKKSNALNNQQREQRPIKIEREHEFEIQTNVESLSVNLSLIMPSAYRI